MTRFMIRPERKFMEEAIRQARIAKKGKDYAIGAVIVKDNKVIVACGNHSKTDENPIAHAETLAIIEACKLLKSRHISDCILYTTHEPCPMCASAAVWAKLRGVVYGARNEDMFEYSEKNANEKYFWRTIDVSCEEIINKSTEKGKIGIIKDFMRKDCVKLFHC